MWKLFNKLFGWDYILYNYAGWGVRKVEWFAGEPYCKDLPFIFNCGGSRVELQKRSIIWKPLTYRMQKYRITNENHSNR